MKRMKVVDPKKDLPELARRIRQARENARLSQNALANGIGVSDKSISAYEQGRSTPPFSKLKKIAQQTNHPMSFFTEENNQDADIEQKLTAIERELAEVRRLLKKAKD
jgi:transcriptional regulator with XRE-family HTH domain